MKQTVNKTQFVSAFGDMDRENNFSREGRELLFDYLEELEEDTGEEIEFDVIGICCQFSEDDLEWLKLQYDELADCEDLDEAADILSDMTMVVGQTDSTIIYDSEF